MSLLALLLAATDPLAGLPGVTVVRYDVAGTDAASIRAAIDAHRPRDPGTGARYDALTHWQVRWRWPGDGKGGCALAATRVDFTATVTLPRHVDPDSLPPDLRATWDAYVAALTAHEAQHVRFPFANLLQVRQAIAGATCATANAAGRSVLRRFRARDVAYDRETRHGETTGAHFP